MSRDGDATRIFVVLNPMAGQSVAADVEQALEHHFHGAYEVYETTGDSEENVTQIVREALSHGDFGAAVAVGGDGTVSDVAEALVGTEALLGIIPAGTANVFAQELGLPLDLEAACALIAGSHGTTRVDVMKTRDAYFVLQIGIGIDALMIRDTDRQAKRRFGRLAYMWTLVTRLIGFQPIRFTIVVDDTRLRPRASQVLIANGGVLGIPPFRWGPDIRPNDGHVDVCIVSARTALDYLGLIWHMILGQQRRDRNVRYLTAGRNIVVSADTPLPIQADGEIIGETPLRVEVVADAVGVIVPVEVADAANDAPPPARSAVA